MMGLEKEHQDDGEREREEARQKKEKSEHLKAYVEQLLREQERWARRLARR